MTRESKKERELRHLRLFQRLCPEAPQSSPESGERPDFTFSASSGRVGIEVTEYFRPHRPNPNLRVSRPLQEQDALKNRVVARAKELCELNYGIRARVQLLFRSLEVVDGRQIESLASAISELIGTLPLSSEHQRYAPSRELRFPSPLTTVFAQTVPADREPFWEVVAAGSVRLLTPADIRSLVRTKEEKLVQYRRDLSEIWLLIAQDYWSRASYAELSDEAVREVYQSHFHRVFFLRVFQSECVDLPVAHLGFPPAT